jgi:hypothetical protein
MSKGYAASSRTVQTTKFSNAEMERINKIAFEKSQLGERVTAAHVVREAVRIYIEAYEGEDQTVNPAVRGQIDAEDAEA